MISAHAAAEETRRFFVKVYAWMFIGLGISAATAYFAATEPAIYTIILGTGLFYVLMIVELGLVFGLALLIKRIPATLAIIMFLAYSFFTGLTLSVIFLVYTIESIGLTFFIAAAMFGIMSVYGYVTKTDLTKIGQILFMALIGIILASVVNFFLKSGPLDYIISIIGVIVFTGLTAYDTQKIRETNVIGNEGTEEDTKESVIGALRLYLDFINLFLSLLRLMGKRRE